MLQFLFLCLFLFGSILFRFVSGDLDHDPVNCFVQLILVRGKILEVEGKVAIGPLGRADTSAAPVLLEPVGRGTGGKVTLSGDYKVRPPLVLGLLLE